MKRKIAEWYIKNKRKIKIIVFLFILIVVLNRILIYVTKNKEDNEGNVIGNSNGNNDMQFNSITSSSSTITSLGEEADRNQASRLEIIDQFITLCNNQDVQKAYDLLSSDCKQELYPNVNDFKTNYYDQIFSGNKKQVTIENWTSNIYKVTIDEDSLSTGIYSQDNSIQDYISVVIENGYDYRLNINGYLGEQEINKKQQKDQISIIAMNSNNYMDFISYTYKITNNSDEEILLSNINDVNAMYIEDQNGIKYSAYTHEISEAELTVLPGETKEITIKYYNQYSSNKEIQKIVFSNIMLNYNSSESRRYGNIQIDL